MENKAVAGRKYVDLFAGCGGLSLGLEKAGFELALAVEKSDMAAETFYHNFIGRISSDADWKAYSATTTPVEEQAKAGLVVKELAAVLESKEVLANLKAMELDLVAGGPPCQGFSLAGRRNPNDVRNQLPWQFLEFIDAVQPKAVLIENVSGMTQNFRKHGKSSPFKELQLALADRGEGYVVQPLLLNAMHFGVPQHRPRVMLVGIRNDVAKKLDLQVFDQTWRSEFDFIPSAHFEERPSLAPKATHWGQDILTVHAAISDLNKNGYSRKNDITEYALEMRSGEGWLHKDFLSNASNRGLKNHVMRKHAPHIETRFRMYQYMRDQKITTKVMAIPKDENLTDEGKRAAIAIEFANAKFPAKSPDGTIVARDLPEIVRLVMELGTKKHSQRPLNWTSPSRTVVSLPDDYVHPSEPRTMTVREMARFQSFPDAFEFRAKETTGSLRRRVEVPQYTQVGNAVPPKLAAAVGELIMGILTSADIDEPTPEIMPQDVMTTYG